MKYFILVFLLISMMGCDKGKEVPVPETERTVTVVKDCTGSYLRISEKDYLICNSKLVTGFHSGETVIASYTHIRKCNPDYTGPICYMYHPYEGWIQILSVRRK